MEKRACPNCGAKLKTEILGGLCPQCVLNKVMAEPEGGSDSGDAPPNAPDKVQPPPPAVPGAAEARLNTAMLAGPVGEQSGDRIGRYKLLQLLGEGGMGSVWMAEQTEPVRRMVALKVSKPGMDSAQVLARFEVERQALALMEHPNIARVLDAGVTPTGRPYFVMDLVKGIPLLRFCDEGRLSVPERLELFIQVCEAIQHAHQKGIIHRDLKPGNVLVALYDRKPVPKVIDFGVAKATGQRLTERTLYTQFGAVLGTLEYMSPEQAELNHLDVDTRSDIYSLGVLLYVLLTGSTPLTLDTLRQAAFEEVLRRIREEEPPKPSQRLSTSQERLPTISAQRKLEPVKLTKVVRGELDWIVMKALEKDRNRRYETANSFAADLQYYLNEEPVLAGPPTARYRMKKFVRKHRTAVAVAAGFAALLTVATVVSAGLALWAARERARAVGALTHLEIQQAQDLFAADDRAIGQHHFENCMNRLLQFKDPDACLRQRPDRTQLNIPALARAFGQHRLIRAQNPREAGLLQRLLAVVRNPEIGSNTLARNRDAMVWLRLEQDHGVTIEVAEILRRVAVRLWFPERVEKALRAVSFSLGHNHVHDGPESTSGAPPARLEKPASADTRSRPRSRAQRPPPQLSTPVSHLFVSSAATARLPSPTAIWNIHTDNP